MLTVLNDHACNRASMSLMDLIINHLSVFLLCINRSRYPLTLFPTAPPCRSSVINMRRTDADMRIEKSRRCYVTTAVQKGYSSDRKMCLIYANMYLKIQNIYFFTCSLSVFLESIAGLDGREVCSC